MSRITPRVSRATALVVAACASLLAACSRPVTIASTPSASAGAEITAGELRRRLYIYADDSMKGRLTGTDGGRRATEWIARELTALGLQPAGDSGTFFQELPLARRVFDPASSSLTVGGQRLAPGTDFVARDAGTAPNAGRGAEVVYGGVWGDTARMLPGERAEGKVVLVAVPTATTGQPLWSVPRGPLVVRYRRAAAIAVINLHALPGETLDSYREPTPSFLNPRFLAQPQPQFFHVTPATATRMLGAPVDRAAVGATGARADVDLRFATRSAGARNAVALLPGSDPALRGQYVAIGAHHDHDGTVSTPVDHDSLRAYNMVVRPRGADSPNRPATEADHARIRQILDSLRRIRPRAHMDSVYNGADDDASGTVTTIEIAEALARSARKPRRSVLFVFHAAEEQGLLGAAWFTEHPTVPRDSIVAQLNMDMVGRGAAGDLPGGGPGYMELIGSRRLSTELGDLVEAVNRETNAGFAFNYEFDANNHPDQYYCRSDHYMYARFGIPVTFFSTGGHVDYHQLTDEPQYIDYEKMRRVAQLVHDIARRVADLDHRIVVDKPKPDPRGACRQ